jgi:predicted DCC family thiol-disulfide oxidoreductase YuxK
MSAPVRHLILYDGVCGLCNRLNQIVLKRDHDQLFDFAAIQSAVSGTLLRQFQRDPRALDTFYVVENYQSAAPRLLDKTDAAIFVATHFGGVWSLVSLLKVFPKFVRNSVYDLIARYRYRVFGRHDTCLRPRPEHMRRFIDL